MVPRFGDTRVPEHVWQRLVVVVTDGCWIWTGATTKGYGRTRWNGRQWYVHRLLYDALVRPVDPLEDVHHERCRDTRCANPAHMEARHRRAHRGHGARDRTHCPRGHALEGPNVYRRKDRPGRECRACRADRQRARGAA